MSPRRILTALAAFLILVADAAPPRADASFRIIVNPGNPATTVDRRFLADTFLKKVTRWPNGDLIRPVDQNADSAVRRRFSDDVIERSVEAVRSYWQQQIFSGREVPPPEVD